MKKFATANWKGNGFDGSGTLEVQSQVILGASYTFDSRFNDAAGTNPEELLAAAYASDLTMKLSFILTEAGFTPNELTTVCYIELEKGRLVSSELKITGNVANIDLEIFKDYVQEANDTCPIFCALNLSVSIELNLENKLPDHSYDSDLHPERMMSQKIG